VTVHHCAPVGLKKPFYLFSIRIVMVTPDRRTALLQTIPFLTVPKKNDTFKKEPRKSTSV